jgi:peptidoglycan/xylan/chitin deacetylase (PgdA/CDA1 family)
VSTAHGNGAGPWDALRVEPPLPERWPNGKLVAVWPVVNIECFLPHRGGPAIQPHLASVPEIANRGWREYGNRAGVQRLARVLGEAGMPASAALNGDVCTLYPDVVSTVLAAGWEVMGHGLNNSTGHAGLDGPAERALVQQALETLGRATGQRPAGWLTPGFAVTPRTPAVLAACGLRYTADATDDDVPYALDTDAGPLLALPYSLETNDISLCLVARYTAAQYAEALVQHVAQLCREARPGRPVLAALGLHTFIAGQPARAAALGRALAAIAALPETWFATGTMIAAALERRPVSS